MRILQRIAHVVACFNLVWPPAGFGQHTRRLFTVADEIGLTIFNDLRGSPDAEVRFSPDGNYVAVWSEHGLVAQDRVEDSLSLYRVSDIRSFVQQPPASKPPSPVWTLKRSAREARSIDSDWRWLSDSSGVAFVSRAGYSPQTLYLADVRREDVEALTDPSVGIQSFDIRDRSHYVYSAAAPVEVEQQQARADASQRATAVVGTGRSLMSIIFPDDTFTKSLSAPKSYLWAALDEKRYQIKENGEPIVPDRDVVLSPDGQHLVTRLPVSQVPESWETLYPPPYSSDPGRLRAGKTGAKQFVLIDLNTGAARSLTEAPISDSAGTWAWVTGPAEWSKDSRAILIPGTYLKSKDDKPSRPCVAVVDLIANTSSCIEMLKGRTQSGREEGYHGIGDVHFENGNKDSVTVESLDPEYRCSGVTKYSYAKDGIWHVSGEQTCEHGGSDGLAIEVKQGLNDLPRLVATMGQTSRVIWDPNPQLQDFDLGEAAVYKWRDKNGHEWEDGLYKPPNYEPGRRYPLVIQTHGFYRERFIPSGVFPTAYAARELAAQGIMVLQLGYHCPTIATPEEGPCMASSFASAAHQLVADGIVDPERIGIIGFSRSCFHVLEALTTNALPLKAASVTDGWMFTYWQQMMAGNPGDESESIYKGPPFGKDLQGWVVDSPGFNLDKVATPLMIVGSGPVSLLFMWEPYAGLDYLHKPVDLILLNTHEHPTTNPAVRMASQGGSVDWFRFWLQGYEDPDPAKTEQYKRWRELKKMQAENEKKATAPESGSN